MTLPQVDIVAFASFVAVAAVVVWLASDHERLKICLSTLALAAAVAAACLLTVDGTIRIADTQLVHSPYARLWLITASTSLLAVHLVALLTAERPVPGTLALATIAATGIALALDEPLTALLWVTAVTAVAAVLPSVAAQLRAATATAALSLVASGVAATVATPGHILFNASRAVGASLLLVATAVAVRSGSVPLAAADRSLASMPAHSTSAAGRAWLPAITLLALVGVAGSSFQPTGGDLEAVAVLIRVAGIAAQLFACWVAIFGRDARLLVGATVAANASLIVFALVPVVFGDTVAGEAVAAGWLPLFGLLTAWAAAWLMALADRTPALGIADIRGWALRRPLLAMSLIVGGALSYGWQGSLPWEARGALLDAGIPFGRIRELGGVLAWLPAFGLLRLLLAGVRQPGDGPGAAMALNEWPPVLRRARRRIPYGVRAAPLASLVVLGLSFSPALLSPGLGDLPPISSLWATTRPATRPPGGGATRSPGPRAWAWPEAWAAAAAAGCAAAAGDSTGYSSGASTQRSISRL